MAQREYTTRAKIIEMTNLDFSSLSNSIVTEWIQAVSRYIDNYTDRLTGFVTPGVDEIRYFDGNGKREIMLDNFISITSLEILELNGSDVEYSLDEGKGNDYIIYPYNETAKYKVILETSSTIGEFYRGNKRIKITGEWGYSSATPADISVAASFLVVDILNKVKGKGDRVTSESLGDYSVSYETVVLNEKSIHGGNIKNILDRYRLLSL